jgi:adenosylhomocysteine nucleosidase
MVGVIYPFVRTMNRENDTICLVFPMGIEAAPFLHRVEVKRRWKCGKATYREAIFEGRRLFVVRCGIGPSRAADAIRNLDFRPAAILSVGTAGSLAASLKIGDMIVASETVFAEQPEQVVTWPQSLVAAVEGACRTEGVSFNVSRLVTASRAIFSRHEREELHGLTAAMAVDMESHAIGLESYKIGIPFTALRVISDDLNCPPLPERIALRDLWKNIRRLPQGLAGILRWTLFLRDFRRAVALLPPVLVRLIRQSMLAQDARTAHREPS